ncbi:MAG: bifunctional 3,4-dihydroxy-2-butanone-4-phosphate synthase/GTP cyclohydrolase II [Armatimonadota bacterium]
MVGDPPDDVAFSSIELALEDLRRGRMIILVDDEDRENEGDFVMAAEHVSAEALTVMTREGSGIITVPMPADRLRALDLDLMVRNNTESMRTAFTVTVDAASGTTTGSSAQDRATTIRRLADSSAGPDDFLRPGHVNPLMARNGGVLKRPGHTEAAVDLMRLAGLSPVGVISEIMGDSGEMSRVPELAALARRLDLRLVTIADLIKHRRRTEKLVRRIATTRLPTRYGRFTAHAYLSDVDDNEYLALTLGDLEGDAPMLCRIHSSCVTGDLLDSLRCDCGDQLHLALEKISAEGRGVLLYIEQEGRGIGLVNKMRAYALQDEGVDTVDANLQLGFKADARDYGIGAQILVDLGLRRLRLMTNNPAKREGIDGFGLEIVERVPIPVEPNPDNARYIETKRTRMGHE